MQAPRPVFQPWDTLQRHYISYSKYMHYAFVSRYCGRFPNVLATACPFCLGLVYLPRTLLAGTLTL